MLLVVVGQLEKVIAELGQDRHVSHDTVNKLNINHSSKAGYTISSIFGCYTSWGNSISVCESLQKHNGFEPFIKRLTTTDRNVTTLREEGKNVPDRPAPLVGLERNRVLHELLPSGKTITKSHWEKSIGKTSKQKRCRFFYRLLCL